MEAMIQTVNSCTISPASQKAESLHPPAQSFHEVFGKRILSDDKDAINSSTVSPESRPAEDLHLPAPSPEGDLPKPTVSEEKDEGNNKEVEPRKVDATFLLNLLPILPNLGDGDNGIQVDASEIQPPGQPSSPPASVLQNQPARSILSLAPGAENPGPNILPLTMAQTNPDSSASAISVGPDIATMLNGQENELQAGRLPTVVRLHSGEADPQSSNQATAAEPKITQGEGAASLLDNLPHPSLGKVPISSQFPGGAVQAKETSPQTEPIPSLFLKPKETTIAPFSEVFNGLPKGPENPIWVTGTTTQNTPWAMRIEAIKNSSSKSESKANPLGQKITLPGVSTDSPMLLEFDEKFNFLLGQNSTEGEIPGRSLNGEFIGWGNSLAEKNSPKVISGGENQPIQETFDLKGILGDPKPQTVAMETGTLQKPQPFKTEHVDLYQQVAEKVIWSIRNNEERIRLTLEPPQLGNLLIELHREKEGIKATLWADNPKTKEILENNQFQLQKTLEGHGLKLEKYDVFLQNDMASFQGKEEKPVFHGTGSPERSLPIQEGELDPGLEILPAAISVAGGSQYINRLI
jgi:hypothetical protein